MKTIEKFDKIQLDGVPVWLHVYAVGYIDGKTYVVCEGIDCVLWDLNRITNHKAC